MKATARDLRRLEERVRSEASKAYRYVILGYLLPTPFLRCQLFAHFLPEPLEEEDVDFDEDYQARFP